MATGGLQKHDNTPEAQANCNAIELLESCRGVGKLRLPLRRGSELSYRRKLQGQRRMPRTRTSADKLMHRHGADTNRLRTERQQEQINDTTKTRQHDTQQEHSTKTAHTARTPPHSLHSLCKSSVSESKKHTHDTDRNLAKYEKNNRNTSRPIVMPTRMANYRDYTYTNRRSCVCAAASRPARTARAPHPCRVSSDPCRLAGSATSWRQQRRQQQRHQPSSRGGKHSKSPPETKSADARPTPG